MPQPTTIVTVAIAVVIVVATGGQLVLSGDYIRESVEDAAEWCDNHDGKLVNSNVVGDHGGLHCELPNGSTVHMDDVIDSK